MRRGPEWFRHRLDTASHAKYLLWRALERVGYSRREVVVKLRAGPRLLLRAPPARDLDTAYELFRQEVYRYAVDHAGDDVRLIVDLGANAGYSLAYFRMELPSRAARRVRAKPHAAPRPLPERSAERARIAGHHPSDRRLRAARRHRALGRGVRIDRAAASGRPDDHRVWRGPLRGACGAPRRPLEDGHRGRRAQAPR